MLERISFEVYDVLASDKRAVILGSLASKLKRTGKIVTTDFAIILTISNDEIVRFQMLEDSFAVSQAARNLCIMIRTQRRLTMRWNERRTAVRSPL